MSKKKRDPRPGRPPTMGADRYDQLARIHADMVQHAPEMALYLDAPSYIADTPFLVSRVIVNGVPNHYYVQTVKMQNAEAKTGKGLLTTRTRSGVRHQSVTTLPTDVTFADFATGPISRVLDLDNISDATGRQDRFMAVQLLHELFHARLVHERHPNWPKVGRTLLEEYEKWSAPYSGEAFRQLRNALSQRWTEGNIEHLLQEKFVIQKTFALYGVHAFNEEIADKYARKRAGDYEAALSLFRELDKAHADVVAPFQLPTRPGQPGHVPAPMAPPLPSRPVPKGARPGFRPFWEEVRYRPPQPAFKRTPVFASTVASRVGTGMTPFRPTQAFVRHLPPVPPIQRPLPAYARRVQPNFSASRDWLGPRRSLSPPSWARSRPNPIRPGTGSGWDPDRFHFDSQVTRMRLGVQSWPRPVMVPQHYGGPANRIGTWDFGSRE